MNISKKIKKLRRQSGLSQEQLANKLEVSRQAITKWETGSGLPDLANIRSLAALFHVSYDDLLSTQQLDIRADVPTSESITEYDIDAAKEYDIAIGDAHEVIIQGSETEKLVVRLVSKSLGDVASNYKVKLDDGKNGVDITIKNIGMSKAQTKEELSVVILLPAKLTTGVEVAAVASRLRIHNLHVDLLEYDGKAEFVGLDSFSGRLDLNCSSDMEITCNDLDGRIDVNQVSAASIIHIPAGTPYHTRAKGRSTTLLFTRDGEPTDPPPSNDSNNLIELNGMNSELTVNEYTNLETRDATNESQ